MHHNCLGVLCVLESLVSLPKVLLLGELRVNLNDPIVINLEKLFRDFLKKLLVDKLHEIIRCILICLSFLHDVVIIVSKHIINRSCHRCLLLLPPTYSLEID